VKSGDNGDPLRRNGRDLSTPRAARGRHCDRALASMQTQACARGPGRASGLDDEQQPGMGALLFDGRSTEDRLILRHAGRATRTLDLSGAAQKVGGSIVRKGPANTILLGAYRHVQPGRSTLGTRRRRRTCWLAKRKRPANSGLFEAAEGIRTLDLLHGKQNLQYAVCPIHPCKSTVSRPLGACRDCPLFNARSRGFVHRMCTRGMGPAADSASGRGRAWLQATPPSSSPSAG
jgi:hypothetical protein